MSFSVGNQSQYTPREAFKRCQVGSVILDIRPELLCAYKAFDVRRYFIVPGRKLVSISIIRLACH